MKGKRKNSKKGSIEVFISKDFCNSMISVLSSFIVADSSNKYSIYAQRLKEKILKHGRTFTNQGEENAAIYFYENEAAMLIKLFAIYVNATENTTEDYFFQIGKNQKKDYKI